MEHYQEIEYSLLISDQFTNQLYGSSESPNTADPWVEIAEHLDVSSASLWDSDQADGVSELGFWIEENGLFSAEGWSDGEKLHTGCGEPDRKTVGLDLIFRS